MQEQTRPFCANERCFMNALEVPDATEARRVQWPDGSVRTYTRDWLYVNPLGAWYPLCHACGFMVQVVRSAGEDLRPALGIPLAAVPGNELLPFCANHFCFAHVLEVPANHEQTVVRTPTGNARPFTRDWLRCNKAGRQYPLCDACGNVAAVIRGDGEGIAPDLGTDLSGQLIGPNGEVLHTAEPEPEPADIDEPEILH